MKRPAPLPEGSKSVLAAQDPKAWIEFPGLREFFLGTTYSDASVPREPGTLTIRPEPARWTLMLKDPTACTQLLVGAPSWDEVILLAETLLLDERCPWTADTWAAARRGKKK